MSKGRYTEAETIGTLKELEAGRSVEDVRGRWECCLQRPSTSTPPTKGNPMRDPGFSSSSNMSSTPIPVSGMVKNGSLTTEELTVRRNHVYRTKKSHEIAIIGMAGRFPGAKSIGEFWKNISSAVESIRFYSDDELAAAGVDRAKLRNPRYVKAGGDLEGIDLFDAALFRYTPWEAVTIDPQQRLFLECAWGALEDAGYDWERYQGLIGVFGGCAPSEYHLHFASRPDLTESGLARLQVGLGNITDSLTARVSYKLNLRGPSLAIQAYCATSGVSTHLACQSLLVGECDIALAGGVNIVLSGNGGYLYEEGGIDSPDGHTRTFDAQASGSVFGDGVGLIVLKRLDEAIADRDHIYAVIKGSAINHDGSGKMSYTAPSAEGQREAILGALSRAGVKADSISYVEAHGTATALGDPIEVTALSMAYGDRTSRQQFCALGSVKTNVGHLGCAAGVTSLIKTALSLHYEFIPPLLHFEKPNPKIDFEHSPFYVCARPVEWKRSGSVRRAGVNIAGVGGTNAHLILEEAPEIEVSCPSRKSQLLLLSANTTSALEAVQTNLCSYLRQNPEVNLGDVAYTLQVGRKCLDYRRAVVCLGGEDAIRALEANEPSRVMSSPEKRRKKSVVFLFGGVGDHYVDMAGELYRGEAGFRRQVDRCCESLLPLLGVDLREVMFDDRRPDECRANGGLDLRRILRRNGERERPVDRLYKTSLGQPVVFTIEYSLAKLLMSWGVMPKALIGYSLGEYVAAAIAGTLTLEDALKLVAGRAQLIDKLPRGVMLAVTLSEKELVPLLGEQVWIAACNSPTLTVVAGSENAIAELEAVLQLKDVVNLRIPATHALHSGMMRAVYDEFLKLAKTVELKAPKIPYVSNLTGTWIQEDQARDPHYWARHMCQTVRYAAGIKELLKDPDRVFVEIGPGQTLGTMINQQSEYETEDRHPVVPTLNAVYQRQSELELLLRALGKLWLTGVHMDWSAFYAAERRQRLSLPVYPFERKSYWVSPKAPPPYSARGAREAMGHCNSEGKIHCFQVEPGEIQSILRQHAGVQNAAVVAGSEASKDHGLTAYVVPREGYTVESFELREYVKRLVPNTINSVVYQFVNKIPLDLDPCEELDQTLLQEWCSTRSAGKRSEDDELQTTNTESSAEALKISTIVRRVLRAAEFDETTSFFEVGANSIDVVRITNLLAKELQFRPGVDDFYRDPTVSGLVKLFREFCLTQAASESR